MLNQHEIYDYSTPEAAIISLEQAYTFEDLEAVVNSKDFVEEAKLILGNTSVGYDLADEELITESAKLLELALIKSLDENGFPDFSYSERKFFNLKEFRKNIFVIHEDIKYPDGTLYQYRIFLSCKNSIWKVVMVEE